MLNTCCMAMVSEPGTYRTTMKEERKVDRSTKVDAIECCLKGIIASVGL